MPISLRSPKSGTANALLQHEVNSEMSFLPLINFLNTRRDNETSIKARYYEFLLTEIHADDPLQPAEITGYSELLESVYAILSNTLGKEVESLWALTLPLSIEFYYSSGPLSALLNTETGTLPLSTKTFNPSQLAYETILQELYDYQLPSKTKLVWMLKDPVTTLRRYYEIHFDNRFIEIILNIPLPEFDVNSIDITDPESAGYQLFKEQLPLSSVHFRGFSVLSLTDVTEARALENIQNLILSDHDSSGKTNKDFVLENLRDFGRTDAIEYSLGPIILINDKLVFSEMACSSGLLSDGGYNQQRREEAYRLRAEKYFHNPRVILHKTLSAISAEDSPFYNFVRQLDIVSYAIIPVYYHTHIVGVIEFFGKKPGILTESFLASFHQGIPLLAQILQNDIQEFQARLNEVIMRNFTALQNSVQWKFNEVALHQLQTGREDPGHPIGRILFEQVYPLYGAIDIRNSTIARNNALRKDLLLHFDMLTVVLTSLKALTSFQLLDDLLNKAQNWMNDVRSGSFSFEEMKLDDFIDDEVVSVLQHIRETYEESKPVIDTYFMDVRRDTGKLFNNRRQMEGNVESINKAINKELELFNSNLQAIYPYYFEKFRTDGVEYDIYIGQSICPDQVFSDLYLKNLRLCQLRLMASVSRATTALLPDIVGDLQTTQLIFAHASPIDIAFRADERRFDVEGAYNIRYQIIKKRIDKVHLKDSAERLTQPGKIAIVYFNHKEAEEYIGYIKFMQDSEELLDDLEYLDLEDVQGVNGLRGLRVGVTDAEKWITSKR